MLSRGEAALWLAFAQFRSTSMYAYLDDTWRVTPRVTINMGLRYELTPPWYDRPKNMVSVHPTNILQAAQVRDMNLHPVLVRTGKGEFYEGKEFRYPNVPVARDGRLGDRLIATDANNWEPRLGLAHSPSSKWTVRTGFGVFYSVESGNSRFGLNRGNAGSIDRRANVEIPGLTYKTFIGAATFPWMVPASPFLWSVKYNVRDTYSMM